MQSKDGYLDLLYMKIEIQKLINDETSAID